MKILFLIRSLAHFSYISTIVASLSREGNQINLSFDPTWSNKHSSHLVQKFVNNYNNIKIIWAPRRKGFWRWLIFFSRELRSYISYLKRTDQSEYYLNRWKHYLPVFIRYLVYMRSVRRVLSSDSISNLLRQFENKVPPDRKIKKFLLDQKPDILVVTPMNMRFSEEVEHVKAANALNIPTVVSVLSWDNLTTKGLFHVIPHLTLVWNKMQCQEAISIHAVPEDKLLVTGSPFFDKWFDEKGMLENRTKFCEKVGFDPSKPFLVYLGSSSNIARDETWLVRELYSCIKRHSNPRVRDLNLLVRPHPANARSYEKLKGLSIVVWPEDGALPETEETQKDFYNSLHHCMLALGINTSGMIDAIINNRPCLTIMAKRYCETQQQTSHFKQLLKANVLEVAQSLNEAMEAIIRIMEGNDRHREQRRQFIRDFIRPCGLDRDAGKVAARAIELTAQGESALKIKAKICI